MSIGKKIAFFIIGFVLIGLFISVAFPKEKEKNDAALIRIGAGDDVSGILMEEIVDDLSKQYKIEDSLESSSFQDCCSNISQWALSAEEINIAFYCSHIALHTIEQNENVMIYGPIIMNAEVISYKNSWEDVKIVGISQGRQSEKVEAKQTYPQIQEFKEVTQKGILYSLEDGQIDAAIQDLTKASKVTEFPFKPLSEIDYISYVLVVDKEFADTKAFADFIKSYNRAVERLNELDYLAEKLDVNKEWLENISIKFLPLEESEE